ncbi:MAG: type IV pilus assembly protein PilM [bacterium]
MRKLHPGGGTASNHRGGLKMIGLFKSRRKTLIGLDIGSNVVKCIRLSAETDRPSITHFAMVPLPPEAIVDGEIMDRELVIQAVMDCAEQAGLPDEPVASAVSGRAVIVKKIVMDKMSHDDAREAIYWEAEQHVPFDIDDISLDFQILREDIGANQMEMLLVAAKKDMILNHAELIRDAGFEPAVIDVASFANQNAWEYTQEELAQRMIDEHGGEANGEAGPEDADPLADQGNGEFVALLDIGGGVTNVHIVKDGIPYFTRDLPIGASHFVEEFQKQLGLTYERAMSVAKGDTTDVNTQLLSEIVRTVGSDIYQGLEPSLSYLKTSGEAEGIDRIVLSGGGAKLPGLREYLASCYDVISEMADPLQALDYDPEIFGDHDPAELSPLLTVGVGLALRKAVTS